MRIFVTDGDNRATLAITRSLGAQGHEVFVGEKRRPSLAQSSRFCAGDIVYPDPVTDSDRFVDSVADAVERLAIDVVLPVADITTFLVVENRERFEPRCAVPFASAEIVHRAANKVDIIQTAARLGVPVPRFVVVHEPDAAPIDAIQFPLVIKPGQSRVRTEAGWRSTSVSYARNAEEMRRDLHSRGAYEFPVMLQECIEGPGVGVFAAYHDGRPAALFSHRRLRERPPWGGVSVLSESTELDPAARDYSVRLLDEIGWHGVAMVEFKRDVRDGLPKLMEINGRFWGSLQLAIDAGVDFPGLLVRGVGASSMPPPQPFRIGVRNRWFWGDVDSLLLTLIGGRGPKGQHTRRGRALLEFLRFWGPDLYYENPKRNDLRPFLLETRRWIAKGLGEGRDSGAARARTASPAGGVVSTFVAGSRPSSGIETTIETGPLPASLSQSFEASWNRLLATSDTNSIFQTHGWNRSWWEAFQQQHESCIVRASGPDGLVGIAPLVIGRGGRDRVLRFVGDGRSDYCDFLTGGDKEGALRAMLGAVFSQVDWDVLELNNLPGHSRTTAIVEDLCRQAGYRVLVSDQFSCPTLLIAGHEESAQGILNKQSLRRPTNYFSRAGRLSCQDLTTADAIEPYLDRFFEQHIGRWQATHSPSLFLQDRNRRFYRALTRSLSPSGALLFSVVGLDDREIAFHYGFDYDGVVTWYKPSFDIQSAAHSPGLVLVRHLMSYAMNAKRRELDFTVGDEPFKRRFTNCVRKTVRLLAFRDASRYLLEVARRRVRTAVKPRIGMVEAGEMAELQVKS